MPNKDNVGRSLSITSQESYIIADMVVQDVHDGHQSPSTDRRRKSADLVHRSNSARSEVLRRHNNKKDETNLAFDGQQTAVVDMDKTNGQINGSTDISKGVILNAQLSDHTKDFINGSGKAIEMQVAGPGHSEVKSKPDGPGSLKDMSVLRRIAFAASFLPSIMFVLCFAVILPCQKKMPCIEEMWTTTLNDTAVTYGPHVPSKVVFAFSRTGLHGLQGLDSSTGITAWEEMSNETLRYLNCDHLLTNDGMACLVSDPKGKVHIYNAETGDELIQWTPTNNAKDVFTSQPVVLPDCDEDGVSEVVVSTSSLLLKVLFKDINGFNESHVEVPDEMCDGILEGMAPWTTENGTDVVGWCKKGEKEHLLKITQEKWCSFAKKNKGQGEISTLDTRPSGSLENSLLLVTEDGLIVWSEENVTKIAPNGQKRWSVNHPEHNSKNRFLLHGKFDKSGSQIALFSSDIQTNLQITTLNAETGERFWNRTMDNAELSDVSLVKGSEKDFVLVVMRNVEKVQTTSRVNEVTTSIINLLTTERTETKAVDASGSNITEKIAFIELNGEDTYKIEEKQVTFSEGQTFTTRVAVIPKQDEKYLQLIVLSKPTDMASEAPSSQLKRINIANWDISESHGNKKCIVKEF